MTPHNYIFWVTGEILTLEGIHYAQNWVGGNLWIGDIECEPQHGGYIQDIHKIDGNLILDRQRRSLPYATYVAYKSVGGKNNGSDLTAAPGFLSATCYYNDNIAELRNALGSVETKLSNNLFHKGLYVEVFATLELFLSDFLLCGIFSCEEYYQNAIKVLAIPPTSKVEDVEKAIIKKVEENVFHRFDIISGLYKSILDINFPDTKTLGNLLHRRHNVVHRFGISNLDGMTNSDVTTEDVLLLIDECDKLVSELLKVAPKI